MLSFDEIRSQYEDAKDLSDNEIISRLAKASNLPIEQVAWSFGIDNAAKAPRSALEVANDTVVNFGNAAIGGVKAAIDFVSPGSRVSNALEGVIESGNRTKSLSTRIADERLGQALSSDELGPQASGVVDYVLQNPVQAAATAAGSFVGPGFAIKGARGGAALLGAGEKGVQRAGTGAAMTTGGMMAGGDAAGDAYDMVYARTGDAELATKAAREASVAPALIGAIGGRFGAEGALAKGGTKSILKTGAAEFGTEFVEEGSTKLSANVAAGQYVDGINPMTGVAGSALMGGILGGGTGLAVGALTKERSMLPGANTRDVGGDLSTGGKTDGSGISTAVNNTDPQGQQFLFGPEQMPDIQGTPRNPYDVGGQVSAFQNNVDTTLGTPQGSLFGTSPEMQSAQIAQANQQQQQVQQQQQQQAQEQQANEARFNALQLFGILNDPNSQRGMFFGNPIIGAPRLTAIADALNNVLPNIPQGQLPIIQALVKANEATGGSLVKLSFKADKIEKSVMNGINALANAMQRYQIDQAQTVEEAADILNTLSQTAKGKQLDEINAIHEQLTGKDTVGYTQSQGAKDGQLQVQGNAGVRAVPERGSATGSDAAGLGLLQSQQVQPVQPGSVAGGQNGQQNVAAGNQGTPAGAAGTVPGGLVAQNASPQVGVANGTQQGTVAPGQPVARGAGDVQARGADGRNVNAQAATGVAPEVSAAEETRTTAEKLIDDVLDLVIRRQGRMSAKVFPAYKTFLKMHFGGVKNADLLQNIADYLSTPEAPVTLDMVKRWNSKAKTFLQGNLGALRAAVDQIATQNNMSLDELLDEINTRIADMDSQQPTEYDSRVKDLEPVSKEEALGGEIDQRDLSGDTGLTESSRKSASLQEQFNGSETVNAKYLRVSEQLENTQSELDAARDEGADTTELEAKVADLEAQLTKLIADAQKQGDKATREIRAKAGKDEAPVKADKEAPKKAETPAKTDKQAEPEVVDDAAAAEKAWDKVASKIPGAPLFAELSEADRETFTEFGPENWGREDVILQLQRAKPEMSTSKGTGKGSDAQAVRDEIQSFIGAENRQKLVVLQSIKDIPAVVQYLLRMAQSTIDGKTQAFVIGGRAYLIADNIAPGKARAIFMHEVGSHLGLQTMLSEGQFNRLVDQILDWAGKNDGSQEHDLSVRAMKRVKAAKTSAESYNNELLAYFIEEATLAGVNPTATQGKTGAAQWLKTVFTAFKNALTKLGFKNMNLTTQDIVDMAFGAARIEMTDALNDSRPAKKQPTVEFSKSASINDLRSGAMDTIGRLPKPYQGAVRQIFDTIRNFGKEGLVRAAFTEDLVNMAKNLVPSAKKWWDLTRERVAIKTKFERRVEEILQEYDRLDGSVKGTGPSSVNKFLKDSTMDSKWGFQPSWIQKDVVDPTMKARFDAMPAAAQAVIKRVFEHGHETLLEMKKGVMENITTEYDALIAAAQQSGDAKELALLQKKKAESLRDYQSLMSIQANTPYAPLKRFGNHVVVGRSQAYLDAEETLNDPNATEDERAEARSQLREYEKDESHYFVQFAETRAEAMSIVRQQEQDFALVQNFKKDDVRGQLYGGRDIQGLFYRLRNLVSESMESNNLSAGEKAINRLVNDLHLSMLSEQSARQSERRRKKVAGADDDMMRAFATQGRATAHFISTLQNTSGIYESLQAMKREADQRTPGREERRQYYNEFIKRHAMGLEYEPHPIIDGAMGATSVWMLLTNPAYYLQNATQPFMMTLPTLAGKHGYGRSQAAMFKAYRELMGVIRKEGLSESSYAKLPADVRNAVERLVNAGRIDISLDQDLGRWRSSEERNAASFAIEKLRGIAQDVESINRVVSAVAAYRLERQSGSSEEKSIAYADKVIYDTHGDYSGANAPRVTRSGVGRMVTQFRKFQLIQLSLMTKLTHQAFKGASAEERMVGRKALAYTLTHLFAMTGLVGLPGFSAIAWALGAAFGDDDEPNNPEAKLRKAIGNDALADLLLKGVPKLGGVDLSGKIGAGTMLSLMPYTDVDVSRDGYARAVVGMLGPFAGGLVPKAVDGVGLMASGDYYKGLAAIAPTGVANAVKGYDYMNRGLTRRNGDVILSPEDVSFLDASMAALGLPTAKITDAQLINRTQSEYEQFFKDRSTDIRKDYVEAYKKGDGEGMTEARQAWADMQESRKRNGFKIQPISELFKAPLEQRKRETEYRKTLNTTGAQAAGFQR